MNVRPLLEGRKAHPACWMGFFSVGVQVWWFMCRLLILRYGVLLIFWVSGSLFLGPIPLQAQHGGTSLDQSTKGGHDQHAIQAALQGWEGSSAGIAYSERNHHVAGGLVLAMGIAELAHTFRISSLRWLRFLLPGAMTCMGLLLIIWSDHEAWPVGTMSFAETFVGQDYEIIQHKTYGILALMVGMIELVRRLGRMGHAAWATPLPLMAIVGGLMLFGHSHGVHPSAHTIAIHHAVIGTMALTAGSSRLLSRWAARSDSVPSNWELLWAVLVLLIGAQLLIYSE